MGRLCFGICRDGGGEKTSTLSPLLRLALLLLLLLVGLLALSIAVGLR
jgi:hypothetical protein